MFFFLTLSTFYIILLYRGHVDNTKYGLYDMVKFYTRYDLYELLSQYNVLLSQTNTSSYLCKYNFKNSKTDRKLRGSHFSLNSTHLYILYYNKIMNTRFSQ